MSTIALGQELGQATSLFFKIDQSFQGNNHFDSARTSYCTAFRNLSTRGDIKRFQASKCKDVLLCRSEGFGLALYIEDRMNSLGGRNFILAANGTNVGDDLNDFVKVI